MTQNHYADFVRATKVRLGLTGEELMRVEAINARVRGYSDARHYSFFKAMLALPGVRDVLILGVYHGRDIAFMRDCLAQSGRDVRITGVDKFSDTPCADWPEGSLGKGWQEAGFGPPPSRKQAVVNCGCDVPGPVTLIESDDEKFLAETTQTFDAVYFDTSHDEATLRRQLAQVPRVCFGDALLCGDDYSDESNMPGGKWGVARAVKASLSEHAVFGDWIWVSSLSLLKP
jgi:hypothetical protein